MVTVSTPAEAVGYIAPGATVAVGGSLTAGHPMALVRALMRARTADLTLVGGMTAGLELDMIVALGLVRRLIAPYVAAEDLAPLPPAIRWAAETGRIDILETDEGIHLAGLRARAQRLPFATWVGGVGTALADSSLVTPAKDDESGASYLRVHPLKVDVALLWAEAADADGNILLWGPDLGDGPLRDAADLRIVQVERIVSTEQLTSQPDRVVPWQADVLVRSPFSTHPFSGTNLACDERWLTEYLDVIRSARAHHMASQIIAFFDEWIHDCPTEDQYLTKVGLPRIRSLIR